MKTRIKQFDKPENGNYETEMNEWIEEMQSDSSTIFVLSSITPVNDGVLVLYYTYPVQQA